MVLFSFHHSLKTVGGKDTTEIETNVFEKSTCRKGAPYVAWITEIMEFELRSTGVCNMKIGLLSDYGLFWLITYFSEDKYIVM